MNEYNIVDKIQSANNLLFASIEEEKSKINETIDKETKVDRFKLQSKNRVTFSSDIEEYDDDGPIEEGITANGELNDYDEAIDKEIDEIIERSENQSETILDNESIKVDGLMKALSIEEVYTSEEDTSTEGNDYATELEVADEIDEATEENVVEEQTEETIAIKLNGVPISSPPSDTTTSDASNRSLPEIKVTTDETVSKKSFHQTKNATRFLNRVSSSAQSRLQTESKEKQSAVLPTKRPHRKLMSAQIGRPTKCNKYLDMNAEEELLKIHLNVKACCEHKYLENNRLPRYNGYISQYGLSKDQLESRDRNRQLCLQRHRERQREILRAKKELTELNELAFRQWLVRKDRLAKPKYKNWYNFSTSNRSK